MTILAQSTDITQPGIWVAASSVAPEGGMTVNICVVNKNTQSSARVDVCISSNMDTAVNRYFIEEYALVGRGTPLLRTGEPIKQGEQVFVRSDVAGVNTRVSGFNKL